MPVEVGKQNAKKDYRLLWLALASLPIAAVSAYSCALLGMQLEISIGPNGGGPAMMGSVTGLLGFVIGGLFGGIVAMFAVLWAGSRNRNFVSRAAVVIGLTIVIGLGLYEDYRERTQNNQQMLKWKMEESNLKTEIDEAGRLVHPEFIRLSQLIENGEPVDYSHEVEIAQKLLPASTSNRQWGALRGYLESSKESTARVQLACLELLKAWFQMDNLVVENNAEAGTRAYQINQQMTDHGNHYLMSFVKASQFSDEVRESAFSIMLNLEAFRDGCVEADRLAINDPVFVKPAAEYLQSRKSWKVGRLAIQDRICSDLLRSFPEKARANVSDLVTKLLDITQDPDSDYFNLQELHRDSLIETILFLGGPDAIDEESLIARANQDDSNTQSNRLKRLVEKVKEKKKMLRPDKL